jgi:rubredoxin
MNYICPVCGFDKLDESAYDNYNDPSFEICPCCRFHKSLSQDHSKDKVRLPSVGGFLIPH